MSLCNPDFKIRIHVCYFGLYNPDNSYVQSVIRLSHISTVLSFAFKNNKKKPSKNAKNLSNKIIKITPKNFKNQIKLMQIFSDFSENMKN